MPSRIWNCARWSLLLLWGATRALAQDFELDLSGETPSPAVPAEFRPTLALLEVVASDGEAVSASRASQLEAELLALLSKSEQFQSVLPPAQAKAQAAEVPTHCTDAACFKAVRAKLKVHRVARLAVQRQGAGSLVTLQGLDPSLPELTKVALDSGEKAEKVFMGVAGKTQAQRDREFVRKMAPQLQSVLRRLATANGKLIVDNRDPGVAVLIDGEQVGFGRVEAVVQRGARTVAISGAAYEPFTQVVTVEPLKSASVEVRLVARPIVAQQVTRSTSVPVFQRPGLYLAIAGVAAAAVGVGLGVSTQGVQQRIDAGGRPVAVTRSEALDAATNAVLANVLVGGGAALFAGGVTWVILTPSTAGGTTAGEPTDATGPSGWTLSMGGTF